MKNICIFVDVEYGSGGTFQYNQQILNALLALPADEYKVLVFYVDDAWATLIPDIVDKKKISYPRNQKILFKSLFGLGAPDFIMRLLFLMSPLRALSNPTFDLILFPSQDLAGLFLSRNSVNVVHDLMHRYERRFKESSGFGRGRFRDRLFGSMYRFSRLILVDSEVGKRQLEESYRGGKAKVEVLPYIAPAHVVNYNEERNGALLKELNLPSKFIFYPAQFWPHKNHKVLLESAIILKAKYPDFKLLFTGPKVHAYNEIYKYCKDNGLTENVTFLDYVPNEVLGGLYRRARAMVMPTFYGPTNIPPLEAIAMGCPVAVSNIYGMPQQLGNAAVYFDNRNPADVAAVLEDLWINEDLRARLKENARIHFENWNQKHFNQKFREIIKSTLTKPGDVLHA